MEYIGITTTIPVEVIYAAGCTPVDLNNIFITHESPSGLVLQAEDEGLPRTICSWVKGIYSIIHKNPQIKKVIAVTEGDCANTLSMLDVLSSKGIEIITFAYPFNRDRASLDSAIAKLEKYFGVSREMSEEWRKKLNLVRKKALLLDEMTWKDGTVTSFENHLSLISCSDFEGDPVLFEKKLDNLIDISSKRDKRKNSLRIGVCGVPPIFSNLYDILEELKVDVVFNEMQRQFAMPYETDNLLDQYLHYTYPYAGVHRIRDINKAVKQRNLDGVIHYIQSFCHHQIQARMLRDKLTKPVLTLEGDKPGPVGERSKIRIESFIEMLNLSKRTTK
jgi:benzoyl-CoA reductase/2-hydroxyglutaryl-CoA dehydratase subunit BcrC/BadD/HgdB